MGAKLNRKFVYSRQVTSDFDHFAFVLNSFATQTSNLPGFTFLLTSLYLVWFKYSSSFFPSHLNYANNGKFHVLT